MRYSASAVSRTCYQGCAGDINGARNNMAEGEEADSDSFQGPQQLGNRSSVLIVLGKGACYCIIIVG